MVERAARPSPLVGEGSQALCRRCVDAGEGRQRNACQPRASPLIRPLRGHPLPQGEKDDQYTRFFGGMLSISLVIVLE